MTIEQQAVPPPREKDKHYAIVVNAQPFTVATHEVTFAQIVKLAFGAQGDDPDKTFTITYRKSDNAHHDGTLVEGGTVKVKNGTVFNVTSTTRS
ncbi:multiubiquitin domain-containing protein [Micromonospora phytophila]|uniref:multiubiquitin domain-containing protein n=1 Tax=Micromonospora phytophila TaxID=709888 RepID=UPI00202F930E|nr:multiubiquitin domain-containing protein [Micromonospora phytophila]MCM0673578.1 multiubiquitin domain-containing protein [Micromonospora phytophila]